jgi:hypothetical protein
LIHDIDLGFNAVSSNIASAQIIESAYLPGTLTLLGQTSVKVPPPCGATNPCSSTLVLSQDVQSASITKDVSLDAITFNNTASSASFSFMDQVFSQTGVPEPFSIMLFGTVLLGCGVIARRRFAQQQ